MKIQILSTKSLTVNHNESTLRVKPQLTSAIVSNHNQGVLKGKLTNTSEFSKCVPLA